MKHIVKIPVAVLAFGLSAALWAQSVEVKGAWVRATVPGQMATGAFMQLTAKDGAKLVAVTTPVAGVAEVHEMKMDGNVMKMRAVQGGLDLPAGTPVELRPGAFHLMLMDLKAALPKDSSIPMTLVFTDAKGRESRMQIKVPVAISAPVAQTAAPSGMEPHQH